MVSSKKIEEWKDLNFKGLFAEAREFYYKELFPNVIERFVKENIGRIDSVDILFSVLGYTPEPIILTARALNPRRHVIFHFLKNRSDNKDKDIFDVLEQNLTNKYEIVELQDESFASIYEAMKDNMELDPSRIRVLDITGGKKSMVASAAIFGRDYDFNITYVDYTGYLTELRRPEPGTEMLNFVYRPDRDLPELFHSNWGE